MCAVVYPEPKEYPPDDEALENDPLELDPEDKGVVAGVPPEPDTKPKPALVVEGNGTTSSCISSASASASSSVKLFSLPDERDEIDFPSLFLPCRPVLEEDEDEAEVELIALPPLLDDENCRDRR